MVLRLKTWESRTPPNLEKSQKNVSLITMNNINKGRPNRGGFRSLRAKTITKLPKICNLLGGLTPHDGAMTSIPVIKLQGNLPSVTLCAFGGRKPS